jgi:DNA replication protein DnaC
MCEMNSEKAAGMPSSLKDVLENFKRGITPTPAGQPRAAAPVSTEFFECPQGHGRFQMSFVDGKGVLRFRQPQCPVCRMDAQMSLLYGGDSNVKKARFVGQDFKNYRVSSEAQKKVMEAARGYADNFAAHRKAGEGFMMVGKPGTGKNHLATAICMKLREDGYSSAIMTAKEIVDRVKLSWEESRESKSMGSKVYQAFLDLDLLVIDEAGRSWGSRTEETVLFDLINKRSELLRPTAAISNYNEEIMINTLTEAGYERILNGATVMHFTWKTHRKPSKVVREASSDTASPSLTTGKKAGKSEGVGFNDNGNYVGSVK